MRDEKEERKKQARSNKQTRQSMYTCTVFKSHRRQLIFRWKSYCFVLCCFALIVVCLLLSSFLLISHSNTYTWHKKARHPFSATTVSTTCTTCTTCIHYAPLQCIAGIGQGLLVSEEGEQQFQTSGHDKVDLKLCTLRVSEIHCRHQHGVGNLREGGRERGGGRGGEGEGGRVGGKEREGEGGESRREKGRG